MGFWGAHWREIRGPGWVNTVTGVLTVAAAALAIAKSADAGWLVALVLLIVVVAQLVGAYRVWRARETERKERERSFPHLLDDHIRKGIELRDQVRRSPGLEPYSSLNPSADERRAAEYHDEAYRLVYEHEPAHTQSLGRYVMEKLDAEMERANLEVLTGK